MMFGSKLRPIFRIIWGQIRAISSSSMLIAVRIQRRSCRLSWLLWFVKAGGGWTGAAGKSKFKMELLFRVFWTTSRANWDWKHADGESVTPKLSILPCSSWVNSRISSSGFKLRLFLLEDMFSMILLDDDLTLEPASGSSVEVSWFNAVTIWGLEE